MFMLRRSVFDAPATPWRRRRAFCASPSRCRPGLGSVEELTAYVADHLSQLTGGAQQLGLDLRFRGDIFVAGL